MTQEPEGKQVPYLSFTIGNFNPNHRIRLFGLADPIRQLFDLASAVGDDSFYLTPKLERPVVVAQMDSGGSIVKQHDEPSTDIYMSFHATGAVNLHVAGTCTHLRRDDARRPQSGAVARAVFKSLEIFRPVTHEEFNQLPARFTPIPVAGLWDVVPVCLDIYQVNAQEAWKMPELADVMQIDVSVQSARKDSAYHFIVWQHTRVEPPLGELAVYVLHS